MAKDKEERQYEETSEGRIHKLHTSLALDNNKMRCLLPESAKRNKVEIVIMTREIMPPQSNRETSALSTIRALSSSSLGWILATIKICDSI